MFEIKINKNIRLDELDAHYQQLYRHIDMDLAVDLSIPKEIENNYVGLMPSLYQYVVTWMRYKKSGKLRLDVDNPDTTDF